LDKKPNPKNASKNLPKDVKENMLDLRRQNKTFKMISDETGYSVYKVKQYLVPLYQKPENPSPKLKGVSNPEDPSPKLKGVSDPEDPCPEDPIIIDTNTTPVSTKCVTNYTFVHGNMVA